MRDTFCLLWFLLVCSSSRTIWNKNQGYEINSNDIKGNNDQLFNGFLSNIVMQ